jgi:hypothetical protein
MVKSSKIGVTDILVLSYGNAQDDRPAAACCRLDYCTFLLSDRMKSCNILPIGKNSGRPICDTESIATGEVASVVKGMDVLKVGRSSGATEGTVNGVKADVKTKSMTVRTDEWVVLGRVSHFAEEGDSGAAVWDVRGNMVGVVG